LDLDQEDEDEDEDEDEGLILADDIIYDHELYHHHEP
jgi:hypothetical protein